MLLDRDEAIQLAKDAKSLMNTDLYKKVIGKAYMQDMASSIALNFEATDEEIDITFNSLSKALKKI